MKGHPEATADIETRPRKRGAHVITLGNEKGGSGKSTTAMHVMVALMRMNRTVGAIDLDGRQRTLSRYIENREDWASSRGIRLPMPRHYVIERSLEQDRQSATDEDRANFERVLTTLRAACDFVLIDSPGTDTYLSRLGHAVADTLITPMNDSFVDFDLLARIDPDTMKVLGPSLYSEMVWESRKIRMQTSRTPIDWVVMRNRISTLDARNKRRVGQVLDALSTRIGFRIAPGFCERVIYREMFPMGLTLLDLHEPNAELRMTMSHVAARQEVREMMATLKLPGLDHAIAAL
ncbi:MAG: division plane positioning ATPase MipZ [Alphaproteobacteria bacterium]